MFHRKTILDLEEVLYRMVLVPLFAFLPARLAYGLARWRGRWRYHHDGLTRQQIKRNLGLVLGEQLDQAERARLALDFFQRHACEAIDVMRLAGRGRALARLVEIRGLEHIEAALAAGKGALICSAHFGSFNAAFSLIGACGFPITSVGDWRSTWTGMPSIRRTLWRLVHDRLLEGHRRPNIEPVKEGPGIAVQMAEILRSNEVIALAIETPPPPEERPRAVAVDFLGRQSFLLPGSINLAQITGSPVLVLVMRRLADWRHQVLEVSPPVPLNADTATAFRRCMAMLETPIRQQVAYWDYWRSSQDLIDFGLRL